jgi:8-oxo-dGTP diphosphatase/2-hydroxy-dATP diphosphatase
MEKLITTLCLIYQHPHVLLGMKKRGFGAGRWNGFGGKVRQDESLEENVCREVLEEAGVAIYNPKQVGILNFSFADGSQSICTHVFKVQDFTGDPHETEEMYPQWFHVQKIPFDEMWPDDRDWVPVFLEEVPFEGTYHFKDIDTILTSKLIRKR